MVRKGWRRKQNPQKLSTWNSFSPEYIARLQSDLFDGGTKQPYKLPRRFRHKRRVPENERANEITRDLIAVLKQCLNQGTSVHQLGNIVSQVLTSQDNVQQSSKRTVKKAKKASETSSVEQSQTAPPVVRFWTDRVTGIQKAYSVDASGWWSWLPHKDPLPAQTGNNGSWAPQHPQKVLVTPGSREVKWVSGLRVADWDPGVSPKLISVPKIREALKEGSPLTGNVVEIWNPEIVSELLTLWDCFDHKAGMTALLFGQAKRDTLGALHTRLSISRGNFGPKLEEAGLLKIGPGVGPWLPSSKKIDMKTTPKVQRETLRVAAPSVFRAPFIGSSSHDSPQGIIRSLATLTDLPVSEFVGGRWSTQEAKHGKQLIVFLRLKPQLIQKLVSCSGKHGLFMTQILAKPSPDFTPFWIRRNQAEGHDAYLRRVLLLQETRKQPVLFRFGPGDNLGFEKQPQDAIVAKPRNHVIHGIPRSWGSDDVETLLTNQNWTNIGTIVRRKNSWVVFAQAPPDSPTRTSWHYELQYSDQDRDVIAVSIQVAVRSPDRLEIRQNLRGPRKVHETAPSAGAPGKKHQTAEAKAEAAAAESPAKAPPGTPVEPRQPDKEGERSRSRSRGRGESVAVTQMDTSGSQDEDDKGPGLVESKSKKK